MFDRFLNDDCSEFLMMIVRNSYSCLKYYTVFYLYHSGDYTQNLCRKGEGACPPCSERLPSCVGVPDGDQPFTGRLWKPQFITCFLNRTILLQQCTNGYFHPIKKQCLIDVPKGIVPFYFNGFFLCLEWISRNRRVYKNIINKIF